MKFKDKQWYVDGQCHLKEFSTCFSSLISHYEKEINFVNLV